MGDKIDRDNGEEFAMRRYFSRDLDPPNLIRGIVATLLEDRLRGNFVLSAFEAPRTSRSFSCLLVVMHWFVF